MNFVQIMAAAIPLLIATASLPAATVTVYATTTLGEAVRAEIHLLDPATQKDHWPGGNVSSAPNIPTGDYILRVSSSGFRSFTRQLTVSTSSADVRVILAVSIERDGSVPVQSGRISGAPHPDRLWVLAVPLQGPPSDITECRVTPRGEFALSILNTGSYLLAVLDGDEVLATKSVYISTQNVPVVIDLTEK